MNELGEKFTRGIERVLEDGAHDSVILVTGNAAYHWSGADRLLAPVLANREVHQVTGFQANPQKGDVLRILQEIETVEFSVIIAIGGGSVMDVAKLIKCFRTAPHTIDAVLHEGQKPSPCECPLYVVPTTAGSGAEATHFAVVYDDGVKFSVAHEELLPTEFWLAPELLGSLPKHVAAAAAMDALSQGIESYWSIHSTEDTKKLSKLAIQHVWRAMSDAVIEKSPSALEELAIGANLAGQAINQTKTTAPHSVSYALTAHFGIPHGHAVMLTLPSFFEFNQEVDEESLQDPRGVEYVQSMLSDLLQIFGFNDASEAKEALHEKACQLGLTMSLKQLGIDSEADIETIICHGFNPQRMSNNPRRVDVNDLRKMLSDG